MIHDYIKATVAVIERATDVDHRKPRRTFPPHLQGSEEIGGSDHPDNLQSLGHACHSLKTRTENPQRAVR